MMSINAQESGRILKVFSFTSPRQSGMDIISFSSRISLVVIRNISTARYGGLVVATRFIGLPDRQINHAQTFSGVTRSFVYEKPFPLIEDLIARIPVAAGRIRDMRQESSRM
ncbi:hypothetical protein TNCV_93341 [Trichonephila clavipes]|nr:hypothetical protein TNCV_93341 [Trichonephila clavipes]